MPTPDLRAAERALRAERLADDVDEILAETPTPARQHLTTVAGVYAAYCRDAGIDLDNPDEAAALAAGLVAVSALAKVADHDLAISAALVAVAVYYAEATGR